MSLIDGLLVLQSNKKNGSKTIVYGDGGIGKSTWANLIPCKKMLYLDLERGAENLEFDQMKKVRLSNLSASDVISILQDINDFNTQGFTTIVIDSLTELEQLVFKLICKENKVNSISDIGYGRGYVLANDKFIFIKELINSITEKGINVVLLGHSKIEMQRNPDGEDYTIIDIDLYKSIKAILIPFVDCIAFMTMNLSINKDTKKANSSGTRILKVTKSASHISKNRKGINDIVQFDDYKKIL